MNSMSPLSLKAFALYNSPMLEAVELLMNFAASVLFPRFYVRVSAFMHIFTYRLFLRSPFRLFLFYFFHSVTKHLTFYCCSVFERCCCWTLARQKVYALRSVSRSLGESVKSAPRRPSKKPIIKINKIKRSEHWHIVLVSLEGNSTILRDFCFIFKFSLTASYRRIRQDGAALSAKKKRPAPPDLNDKHRAGGQ